MYVVLSWFGWSTIRTQLFIFYFTTSWKLVYHVLCSKIGVSWHKSSVSREVVGTSFIHPWFLPSREIIKEHFFMHHCLHLPFPICKIDSGKSLSPCIFMNTVCSCLFWCFKTPLHTHPPLWLFELELAVLSLQVPAGYKSNSKVWWRYRLQRLYWVKLFEYWMCFNCQIIVI